MSSRTAEHARQPSQRLLLKRFAMALGSYALAILLVPIILFNRNQAKEMEGRA